MLIADDFTLRQALSVARDMVFAAAENLYNPVVSSTAGN